MKKKCLEFLLKILLLLMIEGRLVNCDDDEKRMMLDDYLFLLFFWLMISNVEADQKRKFEEKLVKFHLFLVSLMMMMGFFLKVLESTFLDHYHDYRYFHDE